MTGSYFYNKIILIVALATFLVGGFFPVRSVEANYTYPQIQNNPDGSTVTKIGGPGINTVIKTDANGNSVSTNTTPAGNPAQGSSGENGEILCILANPLSGGTVYGCVAQVAYLILGVASWVLWLSAILFNSTINYTLNMAGFIRDIPIVALGWTTFRDVTNLMFVFIILYIAINTIVGNESYGIKKLLGKVIITAMLINFSLFFTQAMIDASNIFALQFYHKIIQDSADRSEGINDLDAGISAAFVNGLGLQEVWGIGKSTAATEGAQGIDINNNKKLGLNAKNLIIVGLGGTVLVLITAFIFFAATIMFLFRAVALIFLMILSPLAFMGGVLPELGKVASKWWSTLTNNLIFAPVYMALLYLVIHMITKGGFKGVAGGGSFYQLFSGNENMIGAAMTFFVLNAMMIGCLLIASNFGAIGSGWAMKTGKSWGQGLSGGLGGIIGRNTIGRGAERIMQNNTVRRLAPGFAMRGLDSVRNAKFGGKSLIDARKASDDKLKKAYDLSGEVRQRSGEDDDAFKIRKKAAQAAAYNRLGIAADPTTGLPTLGSAPGEEGELMSTSGGLIKKAKLSSAQRALLANKDINEEGLQKKLSEEVYDKESSDLKGAHKKLRAKVIERARLVKAGQPITAQMNADIDLLQRTVRSRKHDLEMAKVNAGERELPRGGIRNGPGTPGYVNP